MAASPTGTGSPRAWRSQGRAGLRSPIGCGFTPRVRCAAISGAIFSACSVPASVGCTPVRADQIRLPTNHRSAIGSIHVAPIALAWPYNTSRT